MNYTDPSGHEVNPFDVTGYAEGSINAITTLFATTVLTGEEIVYDFETLERANFTISKRMDPLTGLVDNSAGGCTSVYNATFVNYISLIFGFDSDGLFKDYEGITKSGSLGVTAIGLGSGGGGFNSVTPSTNAINWDVYGLSIYQEAGIDISAILIVEGGFLTTQARIIGGVKKYGNIDEMAQDILSGDSSPTAGLFIGIGTARKLAAAQARYYRSKRE